MRGEEEERWVEEEVEVEEARWGAEEREERVVEEAPWVRLELSDRVSDHNFLLGFSKCMSEGWLVRVNEIVGGILRHSYQIMG